MCLIHGCVDESSAAPTNRAKDDAKELLGNVRGRVEKGRDGVNEDDADADDDDDGDDDDSGDADCDGDRGGEG